MADADVFIVLGVEVHPSVLRRLTNEQIVERSMVRVHKKLNEHFTRSATPSTITRLQGGEGL